ncbi:methyltransferase [Streptomyces mashuensis]|uniref:Methyltransferase n=1 Tax=Streptomyces mashuensis TaxID=33904 RepID=A0A919E8J1_9ACTN|nr:class I SAM-dependent methyltransferase [Streptomyces mashuensis]GHF25297.1 methyltransferase [Streptomyces mashuensis]
MHTPPGNLARTRFEAEAHTYYDTKRNDALNLDLGHTDGYYHHHFAVGDFDRSILTFTGRARQQAIATELHRMETRQVDVIVDALTPLDSRARVLDAGSGRGGTALLLHHAFGCHVDGVNFSTYQNTFARLQADKHGCADTVRFHDRNMVDTGFADASFDAVVTNESTMYVDLHEAFTEFARVLKPGGRYTLTTWCRNEAIAPHSREAEAIDRHYRCHTHRRAGYLRALLDAGLIPYQVDDLTSRAIPYWELRHESELASGIETAYLTGYQSGRVNYIRITSRKAEL